FGMGRQTDAYFIANTIPIVITTIIMLQATRVVQPIFVSKRETGGEAAGWKYLNLIITTGTAIIALICAAGVLLSPILMRLQTGSSPAEAGIATNVSILLFTLLSLQLPIAVMRAALNSFGIFAIPGATKFFENTSKIVLI